MQVNYTLNYQTCDNEIPGHVSGLAKVLGALTSGKRERVTRIQTVLYLIVPTVSLSSGETVQTKWQPCQDEIMTTTEATVANQEKTIQNKLKVLQLTNENTNKIAGSNLLKPIQTLQVYREQN